MPKQNDLPSPVTYNQKFYAKAAGMDVDLPEAITPEQKYLNAIAERGESIGNIGDVEIDNPENGEVMKYDAEQGKWINGTASGGGGTSDYTDLTNKPKINNVTLAGNKSLDDIGAADASEVDTLLSGKVDKVTGKGLSTEDYTTAEKTKLAAIEAGAEANVQADWNQTNTESKDFIKNKPMLGSAAAKGVDSSPTESSKNLVESGGVATALLKKAWLLDGATGIENGTDLNTLITPGNYFHAASGVYTLRNIPEQTAFRLYVGIEIKVSGFVEQIFNPISSFKEYRRYYRANTWSDWALVNDNLAGKANADDIGTMSSLTTTAKTSLVEAINEVNTKANAAAPQSTTYTKNEVDTILTPMTQAQYDALVTKTAPLYFIYEDGGGA